MGGTLNVPHPQQADPAGWVLLEKWGWKGWAGGLGFWNSLQGPSEQAVTTWEGGLLPGGRSSKDLDANPPHGQAAASKWTQPSPARPWCPHLTKEVTYPDSASPRH